MSKPWVRCSREIRLLTDELIRELRILQWSLVGVILLMILFCLWMIRMRRSLNNSKTASMIGTSVETISVQSSPPESPVMFPRSEATSDFVRVSSAASSPPAQNSQISTPREWDSHSAAGDVGVVFSQKPSVVAWFQRCFRVSHLFGLPAPRKVDSSNRTHIPAISGVAANGSSVVGKIATTTRTTRRHLLMVGIAFCLDRVVHAPSGADACSTNSSFVDTFHVNPWNSRDNVEQRVQRRVRRNCVDLVQAWWPDDESKGPEHSCQTSWIQNTSRTTTQTCNSVRSSKVASKAGRVLETDDSRGDRAADLARDQHRRGGRVFLTFPWNWNVLTTWPI